MPKPKREQPAPPPRESHAWMTQAAFVLALGMVIARATMLEIVRDPFEVVPGGEAVPGGPGPAASLVMDLLALVPLLLILARRLLDPLYVLRARWSHVAFALLALWAALSVLWASDKFNATISAATLVAGAALLWSMTQLVRSWMRLRVVVGACVGLWLAMLAHGLMYQFVELPELRESWRKNRETILAQRGWAPGSFPAIQFEKKIINGEMMGFSASPNTFAAVLVLLTTVAAGVVIQRLADRDDIGWAAGVGVFIPVAIYILLLTRSRTALATLMLAAIALALIRALRGWLAAHARLAYFIGAGAFVLAVVALVAHGLYHGSLPHDSLNFRWRYWVGAGRMFELHPLLGVGWANFGPHYMSVRLPIASEEIKDPHNFLVRAFVELGLIGGAIALAWMARTWWELTRPVLPPPSDKPDIASPNSFPTAIGTLVAVAGVGTVINMAASIDWSQSFDFVFVESFKRVMTCVLVVGGAVLVTIRSAIRQELDDRPAPWILYGVFVGLGVFLVHNLVDVAIFEPGPMSVFAALAGAALGIRTEPAPRKYRAAPIAAVLVVVVVAIVAAAGMLVVPVAGAQRSAAEADAAIRAGKFDVAARLLRDAAFQVPTNADYAFRAARAMLFAGRPAPEVRSMLNLAIAADPTGIPYYLTRANVELRQPQPDMEQVRADFERALALNPNDVGIRLSYADLLAERGFTTDAIAQYRIALEKNAGLHPDEPKRLPPEKLKDVETRIAELEKPGATTKPQGPLPKYKPIARARP